MKQVLPPIEVFYLNSVPFFLQNCLKRVEISVSAVGLSFSSTQSTF